MFTGIIEELGTIREAEMGKLIVDATTVVRGTNLGDSIAVNGVDLTCGYLEEDGFHAAVMPENPAISIAISAIVSNSSRTSIGPSLSPWLGGVP